MKINKLIIIIVLFFTISIDACFSKGCDQKLLSELISNPNEMNWENLTSFTISGAGREVEDCWVWPIRFNYYRIKFIFPSSLALKDGVDPNQIQEKNKKAMESSLARARKCKNDVDANKVIKFMKNQKFDAEVSTSAMDIQK